MTKECLSFKKKLFSLKSYPPNPFIVKDKKVLPNCDNHEFLSHTFVLWNTKTQLVHIIWKSHKMSHLNWTDLYGKTVWPQALGFQNLAKLTIFGIFSELLSTLMKT